MTRALLLIVPAPQRSPRQRKRRIIAKLRQILMQLVPERLITPHLQHRISQRAIHSSPKHRFSKRIRMLPRDRSSPLKSQASVKLVNCNKTIVNDNQKNIKMMKMIMRDLRRRLWGETSLMALALALYSSHSRCLSRRSSC